MPSWSPAPVRPVNFQARKLSPEEPSFALRVERTGCDAHLDLRVEKSQVRFRFEPAAASHPPAFQFVRTRDIVDALSHGKGGPFLSRLIITPPLIIGAGPPQATITVPELALAIGVFRNSSFQSTGVSFNANTVTFSNPVRERDILSFIGFVNPN